MSRAANNLRSFFADLWEPSQPSETPYMRCVIAIGHAALSAAVAVVLVRLGSLVEITFNPLLMAVLFGLAYWFLKERPDQRAGGSKADSITDTAFVAVGPIYLADPTWPLWVVLAAFLAAIFAPVGEEAGQ